MHSLFLLQLIQAVLVAIQLVMIFSANKVKREWLTVGQLCIAVVILADLFSELIFFSYTSVPPTTTGKTARIFTSVLNACY